MPLPALAPPAAPATAPAEPSFDMSKVPTEHLTAMFQDPRFLGAMAVNFLAHGRPEGLTWLEKAHGAAKENAFEALQMLEMDDGEGAIKAFNKSGRFTDATGAQKNEDGTWTLTRKNGATATINPMQVRKSLLSPVESFKQDLAERKLKVDQQQVDQQGEYQRGVLANKDEANSIREQLGNENLRVRQLASEQTNAARAAAAQAKADAEAHKADLNNKYGPLADYTSVLRELTKSGDPEAQLKADKVLASHPDVVPVIGKSGAVGIFPASAVDEEGRATGRPLRTYPNAKEYEVLTGRKLPQAPGAAPSNPAPTKGKTEGFLPRLFKPTTGLAQVLDEQNAQPKPPNPRRLQQRVEDEEYLRNQGVQY